MKMKVSSLGSMSSIESLGITDIHARFEIPEKRLYD